jgi:hypothetical protein
MNVDVLIHVFMKGTNEHSMGIKNVLYFILKRSQINVFPPPFFIVDYNLSCEGFLS